MRALHFSLSHSFSHTNLKRPCAEQVQDRNEESWDALWLASNEGHTTLVGMLLGAGADPFLCDTQGVNCLMAAALAGQVATSQLLMDAMFVDGSAARGMLTTLSTVLFCGLAGSDTQLIATALSLGVDPNKLDPFGQSAGEHAVAMNCSDAVLRLLARQGHARLWDSPRAPGLPIVIHIDEALECLHVADSTIDHVQQFLDKLEVSTKQMSEGEPAWLVAIANSSWRSREDKAVAEADDLQLSDAVAQVVARRNNLLRHAEAEVSAVLSGKRAYKLSLHFHVITDVIGAAHAFFKRPALLKQICSQMDPLQRTPLHVAAHLGKLDWVRVLIEAAPSKHERKRMLDASDKTGRSALHMAVESGNRCTFFQTHGILLALILTV